MAEIELGIQQLREIQKGIDRELSAGARDVLDAGLDLARRRSSGTLSYAEMRRQDHPYAKRHGRARQNPGIVNRHTGEFYNGWRISGFSLVNESEHADFILAGGGSGSAMVRRPISRQIEMEMERMARALIERRLRWLVENTFGMPPSLARVS